MSLFFIYVTCDSKNVAINIAKTVIEEELAICANIIENVSSIYYWQGKIEESTEVILITKSNEKNLDKILHKIKELHNYECPAIIAIPIKAGNEDYLKLI